MVSHPTGAKCGYVKRALLERGVARRRAGWRHALAHRHRSSTTCSVSAVSAVSSLGAISAYDKPVTLDIGSVVIMLGRPLQLLRGLLVLQGLLVRISHNSSSSSLNAALPRRLAVEISAPSRNFPVLRR